MVQLYEHGAVRLTGPCPSKALAGHYISFGEIVGDTEDASVCFLSSYVVDQEWLWPHFANVPRVVAFLDNGRSSVRGDNSVTLRTGCGRAHERTFIFPLFPSFPKWGTMHVKFIIIVRPESLRLAIASANLVPYDYESVQNVSTRAPFAELACLTHYVPRRPCSFKICQCCQRARRVRARRWQARSRATFTAFSLRIWGFLTRTRMFSTAMTGLRSRYGHRGTCIKGLSVSRGACAYPSRQSWCIQSPVLYLRALEVAWRCCAPRCLGSSRQR